MATRTGILGISTDTRSMGLAIIRDSELIEWRVKTFKGPWSKDKLDYILRRLESVIEYFEITAIAFTKTDALKESRQQEVFAKQLASFAARKGISVHGYSLHDLRRMSGDRYRSPRKNVADFALDKYPAVRHEYQKERNNKRQYYFRMFEAIVCAHVCAEAIKDNDLPFD